jgi:hypothetical protein
MSAYPLKDSSGIAASPVRMGENFVKEFLLGIRELPVPSDWESVPEFGWPEGVLYIWRPTAAEL